MDGYYISTDKGALDIDFIHHYLSEASYWAKGRSKAIVQKSIEHSLCFGVYTSGHEQVGFARVLTDYSILFYLMDVFIIENHRKKGLSKYLMETIMNHPELQGFQRYMLATHDAHSLYSQFGFELIKHPEWFMEIVNKPS
jgi:GNAT superfamily N-acetyltransferase